MSLLYQHLCPNASEVFPGPQLDEETNGVFRWRTIKNLRSKRKIPESCFLKVSPRKVLIIRDAFLEWAEQYARSQK